MDRKPIDRARAEQLIRVISEAASKLFLQAGSIPMLMHFPAPHSDQVLVVPLPTTDGASKDLAAGFMRYALAEADAEWVVCVTEAWVLKVVTADAAQAIKDAADGGIADHPQREEILHLQMETTTLGCISAVREIHRDAAGKPSLGPLVIHDMDSYEGRFIGLLPNKGRAS